MSQHITQDELEASDVTLESLATRMDTLGAQMDWLCENLQSLFVFVQQIGSNGGGIRGLMQAMKQAPPEMKEIVNG